MLTFMQFKKRSLEIIKEQSQSENEYEHIHRDDLIEVMYESYQLGYIDGQKDK